MRVKRLDLIQGGCRGRAIWWLIVLAALPVFGQTNLVVVKGHPAHASRLLAKLKSPEATKTQSAALSLNAVGLKVHQTIPLVPGLVILEEQAPRAVLQTLPVPAPDPKQR